MMLELGEKEKNAFFTMYPFFSAEERKQIVEQVLCRMYKKGETIFSEGEFSGGLFYLLQGKVKVYRKGVSGKEQIIRLAKPWGPIGFQACLTSDAYIATAKTLESSVVCYLHRDHVNDLLKGNVIFSNVLLQYVSRALKFADMRMLTLTQKHIRARLVDSLMLIAETYGLLDDGKTLNACFSREDLAKLSNMTASNATRTLADFQKEGLIKLGERGAIQLLNIPAITRVSKQG